MKSRCNGLPLLRRGCPLTRRAVTFFFRRRTRPVRRVHPSPLTLALWRKLRHETRQRGVAGLGVSPAGRFFCQGGRSLRPGAVASGNALLRADALCRPVKKQFSEGAEGASGVSSGASLVHRIRIAVAGCKKNVTALANSSQFESNIGQRRIRHKTLSPNVFQRNTPLNQDALARFRTWFPFREWRFESSLRHSNQGKGSGQNRTSCPVPFPGPW
jgi:hypothetical protein